MRRFFFLLLLFPLLARAATERKISLREALRASEAQNQELVAQRLQELQAISDVDRVRGEFGPRFEGSLGLGPITKAYGNATSAVEDKGVWGRSLIGDIKITQPIFSWNRRSDYRDAAKAGVRVKEGESQLKAMEVREQVKQAYYGLQFAASLMDFIASGKKELEKSLASAEKNKKAKKKDQYKLEIFLAEVASKEAEVRKHFALAKAALALRVGSKETLLPEDLWLSPEKRTLEPLAFYVQLAEQKRPEFRQLEAGIFAKQSLARAEAKGVFPIFGAVAEYEFADTNVRTKQPGVFAYDPYNNQKFTLGVGFRLDLQWALQRAKASRYRAEAMELEAKQRFALQGIPVDVEKAYLEASAAESQLEAAAKAYKTGKQWLMGEIVAFSAGLGKQEELIEAYSARAGTVKDYYEALYNYHMAWAALSRAVGQELDPALR